MGAEAREGEGQGFRLFISIVFDPGPAEEGYDTHANIDAFLSELTPDGSR